MNCIVDANIWRTLARAVLVLLLVAPTSAWASGLTGRAYVRTSSGGIGPPIPNVALSSVKEDGSAKFSTTTDAKGRYSISLAAGRYYALASHVDYEDYASAPGFFVVRPGNTKGTANYFLREPVVTTVLIVRHAEREALQENGDQTPLTDAGWRRAHLLKDTLLHAGITAVYSTNTKRTLDTVKPLATTFLLVPQPYPYTTNAADTLAIATQVLDNHRGDVVLVAAHSNTVGLLAKAFCAQLPDNAIDSDVSDFDNLYVVSVAGNSCNVVNFQYGALSQPDGTQMNHKGAMTVLLVGNVAAAWGAPHPEQLLHVAHKAGIGAIFTSRSSTLIARLANELQLMPVTCPH